MMKGNTQILSGFCPNPSCGKKLFFPEYEASVECSECGQRHTQSVLRNLEKTSDVSGLVEAFLYQLKRLDAERTKAQRSEETKVNGLSNYLCTILSPLLTTYGMDKASGKAKLLTDMGRGPTFDCGQLCDRAFLIDPDNLNVIDFGRDRSGSGPYLKDTLKIIQQTNDNEERLIPIHADGDGHCLVHAISRALVGWELFWHPLRVNLKQHFIDNLHKYKMQFSDFIDDNEWQLIIKECDPEFTPTGVEPTGLRNIHVFGLANVLRRPIILLDSVEGMNSPGDYSGVFLPYFSQPSACRNKEGVLNLPLVIAWSSPGRNHFIPLVGVKGKKCPVLPGNLIPRVWGVSDSEVNNYIHFDEKGLYQIGGEKVLQVPYIQRLVGAMSEVFYEDHRVSPSLIADMYQQVFKANGLMLGINVGILLEKTKRSVNEKKLFICLSCHHLALAQEIPAEWCRKGGELYDLAVSCHKQLKDGQNYKFPLHGVVAKYDLMQDRLIPDNTSHKPSSCSFCQSMDFREVEADYTVLYRNGDKTQTKSSKCECGFKHFWNGKEYDSQPKTIPVVMEWKGETVKAIVHWFQNQEDSSLNSNVYEISQSLVQEHFPGEFGSERLVQTVVNQILMQTERMQGDDAMDVSASSSQGASSLGPEARLETEEERWSPDRTSKTIITGFQSKSIHKEELNKSKAERQLKQRIESNAPKQQRKLSDQTVTEKGGSPSPVIEGLKKTPELGTPPPTPQQSSSKTKPSSPDDSTVKSTLPHSGSAVTHKPPELPSGFKRVRLSTSDGKNLTLDLPAQCTFSQLQAQIAAAVNVRVDQQRIRHGFPPRELKPPEKDAEDYEVPIQHGDKVTLDLITPVREEPKFKSQGPEQVIVDRSKIHGLPLKRGDDSWTSFASGQMDESSDRVLQRLIDRQGTGGDNLDHSISALALTAALENKDLWTYVQRLPHLFSVNGLFYKQVERDVGLEHGKHCTLPLLSHKVFVYNANDDRLELCLEPYGHFAVEHKVEMHAQNMLPTSKCGTSSQYKPFSGQGHSLRTFTGQEDRMPTDVPMSPKRHEARRLNTLCDPTVHQESIEEADEESEMINEKPSCENASSSSAKFSSHCLNPIELTMRGSQQHLTLPEPRLIRKGPGYSELSPIPENSSNESEKLHQLVSCIEQAVESMGQEADAMGEIQDENSSNSSPSALYASAQKKLMDVSLSFTKLAAAEAAVKSPENSSLADCSTTFPSASAMSLSSSMSNGAARNASSSRESSRSSSSSSSCEPGESPESNKTSLCPSYTARNIRADTRTEETMEADTDTVATLAWKVASGIAAMDSDFKSPVKQEADEDNNMLEDGEEVMVEQRDEMEDKMEAVGLNICPSHDLEGAGTEGASEMNDLFISEAPANCPEASDAQDAMESS